MIYKHEDGTISTFYQKGETVEYPSDEEVIKYIDNAESWDVVDKEVYEELCKRLGIDSSEFDDPDNLFIEIQTQFIYNKCNLERWRRDEIREDFENGLTFEEVMTKINNENKQDILHEKEKEKVISFSKDDEEIEFKEGEHTMINEKYRYEDFEKIVKLAALEDYKYSYNEMQGAHQFTNGNNDECIEVNDYSTADGKPDNWDGDVHSDWNKICMELVEEFSGIVPGIHKKDEVWNLSDAESNEKSKGLNPIEKAEEMEF